MDELLRVEGSEWKAEILSIKEPCNQFGSRLPKQLWDELKGLEERLGKAYAAKRDKNRSCHEPGK